MLSTELCNHITGWLSQKFYPCALNAHIIKAVGRYPLIGIRTSASDTLMHLHLQTYLHLQCVPLGELVWLLLAFNHCPHTLITAMAHVLIKRLEATRYWPKASANVSHGYTWSCRGPLVVFGYLALSICIYGLYAEPLFVFRAKRIQRESASLSQASFAHFHISLAGGPKKK